MANYFIKIEDGPDVRRKILESSKASIHILKGYQQLLAVRGQKLSLMNDLRRELKELTILLNRADALMPQLSQQELDELTPKVKPQPKVVVQPKIDEPPAKPAKPSAKQPKVPAKKIPVRDVYVSVPVKEVTASVALPKEDLRPAPVEEKPKPKMTELEKLEAALASVEQRLGNL